jgi:hypothetical protein
MKKHEGKIERFRKELNACWGDVKRWLKEAGL